jgi:hypothetical protein
MPHSFDWKKYLITLLITAAIFFTALFLNNYFNNKRLADIKNIQSSIATDIASSEVQYSLLGDLSCQEVTESVLSPELNDLADRIQYGEQNLGPTDESIIQLKKDYSLLEIKDYLLMKKISDRCGKSTVFVLYFYSNTHCDDCVNQGYVLTALRQKYPQLRVYSFDYDLDLSAIKTLINIYKLKGELPAMVIEDKVYYGFNSTSNIEKDLPVLATLKASSSATTTKKQ